ncbi:MAG: SLC13/DASS family transporter [Pseudomonadales bacterium]|nr:SLC13/DASS family transporter [Pseudomonadales bacterium]
MKNQQALKGKPRFPIGIWLGPLSFFITLLLPIFPNDSTQNMAAIALWMVIWWVTEALPLAATALLPIILFPLMGITKGKEVAAVYMNSTIFLFLGGFILALAMERWNLHQRIALTVIRIFRGSPALMILGFMLTSAGLSMWISNTATATMLLPIGLAVFKQLENQLDADQKQALITALMLAIAYSCSIGGVSTLIGTPPNMALQRIFAISFPDAPEIAFGQWLIFILPLSFTLLLLAWQLIVFRYIRKKVPAISYDFNKVQGGKLPLSYEEKVVGSVFTLTALAWIFRKDLVIGSFSLPGWSHFLAHPSYIDDGTIAIAAAVILFLIPTRNKENYQSIIDVSIIPKLPWHIILLFGGGFALATGFAKSGLSGFIGQQFLSLGDTPPMLLIGALSLGVVFLTEVTSNTATAEMLLPLVASIASVIHLHPLLLMLPVAMASSMAFMMPVATPPNAIVFGSGHLKIKDMIKTGLILNLLAIVLITLTVYFLAPLMFDIDLEKMPEWAKTNVILPDK